MSDVPGEDVVKLAMYRDAETHLVHYLEILGSSDGKDIYYLHCAPIVGRTVKQRASPGKPPFRSDMVISCFWCLCGIRQSS